MDELFFCFEKEIKMRKYFVLFLIVILAVFLRFYQLGQNPPSISWDEAAWGYNAYSLGIDGRDEFGRFLPHDYLESFGDFKPPVYAYLDIMPVKIFGLNEFAVRFPSAILGSLTVLITYFLVLEIFSNRKWEIGSAKLDKEVGNRKEKSHFSPQISVSHLSLLTSFLLAISPWHINLSRAAFEANVATFFIVCGVWLFLAAVHNKKWLIVFSAISFVLSMYTFNTSRIVSPLLVLMLAIGFRKKLLEIKRETILAMIVGILLILPTFKFLISPQASLRFKEVNIFTDGSIVGTSNTEITNDQNVWWSKVIHNRRFLFAKEYLRHYFDNLNPNFLFIRGDGNPKFSTRDVGELYLLEVPFLVGGLLFIFKKKWGDWWLVPLWLVVGIIPAATARETPHALRIETILPTFQILTAVGLVFLFEKIKDLENLSRYLKKLIFFLFALFLTFNFLYYFHGYYAHYPREYSGEWQYGYKDSISYVQSVENNYDQINITDSLGRPYIYYLFYTKTDPKEFQKTANITREAFGFVTVNAFDKYRFAKDIRTIDNKGKRVLYINNFFQIPNDAKILKTFYLLNGSPILAAYTI
ncbi:MAG: glycosyltransferase family 39 protein [Candidatus Levybacteria bacterium]|nr:glycosyltransferase family 39 protein [Candidatus Levybacteria bacterium]